MSSTRWKHESNNRRQNYTSSSRFDVVSRGKIKNCSTERFKMIKRFNYNTLSYYICLTAVILITPNTIITTIQSVSNSFFKQYIQARSIIKLT